MRISKFFETPTLYLIVAAVMMISTGCQTPTPVWKTYSENVQKGQDAILILKGVYVVSVDKKTQDSPSQFGFYGQLRLLPGTHRIEYEYVLGYDGMGHVYTTKKIEHDLFEAGKVYETKVTIKRLSVSLYTQLDVDIEEVK